ncbi:PilZ domain-containing protein [Robertmurraya korlensis]|uniref:PilZ domain-containing protein n=1 Tax=Robertmurraya korlensis TaxID=519977 RepID=UPI0008261DE8|nr:PilZ domain-containing protein [Robertmurraya korlensis]
MIYKRQEAFRFQFQQPIHGTFKIISINGVQGDVKSAIAYIVDISPNGIKFKSPINLPIEQNDFLLEVSFLLADRLIRVIGTPKWKKIEGKMCVYGFTGLDDKETKEEIINVLKIHTKMIYNESKVQDEKAT